MAFIIGSGLTAFGRHPHFGTLDLMAFAAAQALADAGLERRDVDGLICGYSTTMPHLMLSTVFAEHFGLQPQYAHAVQLGGATGFAMAMLAHYLVEAGAARRILVVAGENRLTGQTRTRPSRRSLRSATPSTRFSSDRPFRCITGSSRHAICTSTGSPSQSLPSSRSSCVRTRRAIRAPSFASQLALRT